MKYYRLSEDHPMLGLTGHIIPDFQYKTVAYTDRAMYDKVNEDGKGFPYKTEVSYSSGNKSLYYLETFAEVIKIINKACAVTNRKINDQQVRPENNFNVQIGGFTITVTFRPKQ